MAASPTPAQWLLLILAAAVAVSGWIYGAQWKRVATGGDTTHEEKLIIDLQDQIERLRGENERLSGLLHAAEKRDPVPESTEPPGTPPPVAQ
jgi:hypothetical protein